MKVLEGIEKLELVKAIYEMLGMDFTDVTIEEAFAHYNKIVDTLTPTKVESNSGGTYDEFMDGMLKQMSFGRKLSSFIDAPSTDESDVDFEIDDLIHDTEVIYLNDEVRPYTHQFGSKQFWLVGWRGDYYFIDTQGYDYARYCTKLTGFNLG